MKPVLLVIAGPNGSGKTTVTVRLRADRWSEGVESAASIFAMSWSSSAAWAACGSLY